MPHPFFAGSVDQLRCDLLHVAGLAGFDDLNSFLGSEEPVHRARAWLLQILVVLPVVGGLLLPVLAEILEALDVVHPLVIGQDSDVKPSTAR